MELADIAASSIMSHLSKGADLSKYAEMGMRAAGSLGAGLGAMKVASDRRKEKEDYEKKEKEFASQKDTLAGQLQRTPSEEDIRSAGLTAPHMPPWMVEQRLKQQTYEMGQLEVRDRLEQRDMLLQDRAAAQALGKFIQDATREEKLLDPGFQADLAGRLAQNPRLLINSGISAALRQVQVAQQFLARKNELAKGPPPGMETEEITTTDPITGAKTTLKRKGEPVDADLNDPEKYEKTVRVDANGRQVVTYSQVDAATRDIRKREIAAREAELKLREIAAKERRAGLSRSAYIQRYAPQIMSSSVIPMDAAEAAKRAGELFDSAGSGETLGTPTPQVDDADPLGIYK